MFINRAQGDGVRKGYMGHIIKIINHIDSVTNEELKDFIKSVLSEDIAVQESWNAFVSGPLKDITETQNVLLGGVHPVHCKSHDLSEELQVI